MRKLIYAINVTLDGCCDHTKTVVERAPGARTDGQEEILEHYARLMRDIDLMVYGRKTYQLMVPFWPDVAKSASGTKAANEFARAFDSIDKLVFSQSLDGAQGANTRIARTGLQNEVLRLKQERGKNILTGGVNLPSQLIELGLVDECRVVVHPIIVGEGPRLLDGRSLQEKLALTVSYGMKSASGSVGGNVISCKSSLTRSTWVVKRPCETACAWMCTIAQIACGPTGAKS